MSRINNQMSKREFTAHVAAHGNEHEQHYVEALYDENAELRARLAAVVKAGYTDDGRAALRKVGYVVLVLAIATTTFLIGKFSN